MVNGNRCDPYKQKLFEDKWVLRPKFLEPLMWFKAGAGTVQSSHQVQPNTCFL